MIAVCALGWNMVSHTERWLSSLRRNSVGHDVQLYLMDNGSTDGGATEAAMRRYEPAYFQRNDTNESIYKGWNTLARETLKSDAEVICVCSNDVICGPRWLDGVVREIRKGGKKFFHPGGIFGATNPDTFEDDARALLAAGLRPRTRPAKAGWCWFFSPDAVREWLPISEELRLWYGDDHIHWKLRRAGYVCESIDDSLAFHIGSVSFYATPGYVDIVEQDRLIYNRITGESR